MAEQRVLTWDWREQPDLDRLAAHVRELSGGKVRITTVDTGSDQYAIVIADRALTADEAYAAYEAEWS